MDRVFGLGKCFLLQHFDVCMGLVCILKKRLITIYSAFLSASALCVLYLNSGRGKVCLISLEEFMCLGQDLL